MKILVGVMYCIENELEQCLTSIEEQTLPAHDIFILSNLPNKEAHNRLYQTFMSRRHEADLFVKIDADMVLDRKTFFEEVSMRFLVDSSINHIQIAVDDWYTNRKVMGLHLYRNDYRWIRNKEAHFVDLADSSHNVGRMVNDWSDLAPAAAHSPNPSPFQAFHFGIHKAIKVSQCGRPKKKISFSFAHWENFIQLERHYRKTHDRRLAVAIAGFLHATYHLYEPRHVDYSCQETIAAFETYKSLSAADLEKKVYSLAMFASPKLPNSLRFELAYQHTKSLKSRFRLFQVCFYFLINRSFFYKIYWKLYLIATSA